MLALQHLRSHGWAEQGIPDWFLLPFTLLYELKHKLLFCVFLFRSEIGKKPIECYERCSEIWLMSFFFLIFSGGGSYINANYPYYFLSYKIFLSCFSSRIPVFS